MTDILEAPISTSRRKPATIQTIHNLRPHPNADRLELGTVLGYQVVVGKGSFQEGDPVVFIEEGSILPEGPEWSEFLRKENFRVKACKLRGQLSQGLVQPISILHPALQDRLRDPAFLAAKTGIPVHNQIGVKLYVPPASKITNGQASGLFPTYVPKTDELRLQSYPKALDEMQGLSYFITTKYDGMSGTFIKIGGKLVICSRNYQLNQSVDSPFLRVAESLDLKERIPEGYAVQGEVCGPNIQGNKLELDRIKFFAFQVRAVGEVNRYLDFAEFMEFCSTHGIPTVPVVEYGEDFSYTLEDLLEMSKGYYPNTTRHQEGIVVRPQQETWSPALQGRLSFKVISPDYDQG